MNNHQARTTFITTKLWRILRIIGLILLAIFMVGIRFPLLERPRRNELIRNWSRKMMKVLKFKVLISGNMPKDMQNTLVMANHISWVDSFALGSVHTVCFVAKKEIQSWPVIGKLIDLAGTVFIDRSVKKEASYVSDILAKYLSRNSVVAVFPEATTSDGLSLLPLKSSLFESAITSKGTILPVVIRYYDETGAVTTKPYFGDITLMQSLWRVLDMKSATVELIFCEPYSNFDTQTTRYTLCKQTEAKFRAVIAEHNQLPRSDSQHLI